MKILIYILSFLLFIASSFAEETKQVAKAEGKKKEKNEKVNMDTVILETNLGNIEISLNGAEAPISVANFKHYVSTGFYDGLIFHRVIKGFMIQGGGFDADMKQKTPTNPPIKNEADNMLKNSKYTLAMARTMDINSATSQFFININNNDFLNHGSRDFGYAVFGKVISGTDVVDKIATVSTKISNGHSDVPAESIVIKKAYLKKAN